MEIRNIFCLVVVAVILSLCLQQFVISNFCILCSSPGVDVPCLIDLETGALLELAISKNSETFSLLRFGSATGYRTNQEIRLKLPMESASPMRLCRRCRASIAERYVLADLRDPNNKKLLLLSDGETYQMGSYLISISDAGDGWLSVIIQLADSS